MQTEPTDSASPESRALAQQLVRMVTSSWMSQALYVAAVLGIPDLLVEGAKRSEELARLTTTHQPSLHRLLRALTTLEICSELDDGSFALTPLGSVLSSTSEVSVRSWTMFWGGSHWPVWGNLLASVRTGQSARTLLTGTEGFAHLERDPALARMFNQAMIELTRLVAPDIIRAYDFSAAQRIMDVGGGQGHLLAAILQATPGLTGVLFDMPHATEGAAAYLEQMGVAERCSIVTGDFFENIPGGADIYLLKSVIHDWNDQQSSVILANCRRAMAETDKLLLVENMMPERLERSEQHRAIVRSDLNMLVGLAAQERTEHEFNVLLNASGFAISRIVPTGTAFWIIEASASH